MKKFLCIGLFTLSVGFFNNVIAQDSTSVVKKVEKGVTKTGKAIGKGAKAVGEKTSEIASKGKAAVVDKEYKDKVGPAGQTIYIDKNARYYWINKKGHRHFTTKAHLKDKES